MTNAYSEAVTKVAAYRSAYSGKKKGFLIKAVDIADFISAYGSNIDGVRLYIGLDNGDFEAYAVGTVKDASGNFNDVNVENATIKMKPCPVFCNTTSNSFT